jgi:hypothetical protein
LNIKNLKKNLEFQRNINKSVKEEFIINKPTDILLPILVFELLMWIYCLGKNIPIEFIRFLVLPINNDFCRIVMRYFKIKFPIDKKTYYWKKLENLSISRICLQSTQFSEFLQEIFPALTNISIVRNNRSIQLCNDNVKRGNRNVHIVNNDDHFIKLYTIMDDYKTISHNTENRLKESKTFQSKQNYNRKKDLFRK